MTQPALLMTLTDVARLARVQRPVVSMWRQRAANTGTPFPTPTAKRHGGDVFDAEEVGAWLAATKRGNNPDAAADAAAFAALNTGDGDPAAKFLEATALLALRSLLGEPLGGYDRSDLLDAADAQDPDDSYLYREIDNIDPALLSDLTNYVDALVDAAYNEAAAFEALMTGRGRRGLHSLGDTALTAPAIELLAETAQALTAVQPLESAIVDAYGSANDVLIAIATKEHVGHDLSAVSTNADTDSARLQRRRLLTHRVTHTDLRVRADGSFDITGHAVHVAHLPSADHPGMTPAQILGAIDQIAAQMDDNQLAVILAPSVVLADASLDRECDELRSGLLRAGRVRAVVRLPAGLLPHKPQQAQALWVLGAAHENVAVAERWIMVADLSTTVLTADSITDLVGDLVASLGDRATARAHAFRFSRLAFTRTLLAGRGSLVDGSQRTIPSPEADAATHAVRAEQLLVALNAPVSDTVPGMLHLTVESADETIDSGTATMPAKVEQLIASGQLRYFPGNRVEPADVFDSGTDADGIRLIGPGEVFGNAPIGGRRIDRLHFAAAYPSGRVTEPGDVIFCTTPRPAAIVDAQGTSVVSYPARILRISRDCEDLLSEVVAADITGMSATDRRWRRWSLRRVPPRQKAALADALAAIRSQQQHFAERLSRLDQLSSVLIHGITNSGLTITTATSAAMEGTT